MIINKILEYALKFCSSFNLYGIVTQQFIKYVVNISSLYFLVYLLSHVAIYWICSICYYIVDRMSVNSDKIKYFKLQPKQIDFDKYHRAMKVVLLNQIYSLPFIFYFMLLSYFVGNDTSLDVPPFSELAFKIFFSFVIFDLMFYAYHYLAHSKRIYSYIHKKHHEFTAPVAVAANYNSFLDHIIANFLLPGTAIILTCANMFTMIIWFILGTITVTSTHSGYWICLASKHDIHHEKFNYNYGIFFTDYLFGTSR